MSLKKELLGLNNHKIIQTVRESLNDALKKSQNIITVKDDILYVWNFQDSCVLTLNLKLAKDQSLEDVKYQTLLPTHPIAFKVTMLRCNNVENLLAVGGPKGVCILELPQRVVSHKDIIYCRSHILDERLFSCSAFLECQQMKWHPGSLEDNHLLVLTSDNEIRVYTIDNGTADLSNVWSVGRKPMGRMGSMNIPTLVTLGETGVDFDIGPPETSPEIHKYAKKPWEAISWPIYILRGNGNVYMLHVRLNGNAFDKPILRGPLRMQPVADDNYGVEACAIICLQSNPPVIGICTCTGTIYHSVALAPEDMEPEDKKWLPNEDSYLPKKNLFVFESIELELGFTVSESQPAHTCPIYFQHDEMNKSRYFCAHDTGVHAITVPMVGQLNQYTQSSEDNSDLFLPSLDNHSLAEYLICTHAAPSSKMNYVLGVTMTNYPSVLICLLSSGQVVTLPIVSVMLPPTKPPELSDSDNEVSPAKKILKQQFDEYIKSFLKPNLSQPIFKLTAEKEPNPQECFELLSRTTQTFREEHFQKHEKVREEIEKRVKALQILKKHQLLEIKRLEDEKKEIQKTAEHLAEKYEDIKDKQEELTLRAELLLRVVNQRQPQKSNAEKNLINDLHKYEEKLKYFVSMFEQIKNKRKYQELQIEQWKSQQKKKESYLSSNQNNVIKNNLSKITGEITELRKEVVLCKQDLGIQ